MKSQGIFLLLPSRDRRLGCPSIPTAQVGPTTQDFVWTLALNSLLPNPPTAATPVTAQQSKERDAGFWQFMVFLVDCTLVKMYFNQMMAKQWVSLWFRCLQAIKFNVEDHSQTTIGQMALVYWAPLSQDMLPDPKAEEPWLPPARWHLISSSQAPPLPPSAPSSVYAIFFQTGRPRWERRPWTQLRGLIKLRGGCLGNSGAWNQKVHGHIPLTQLTYGAELYSQKSTEWDAILPANKLTLSIK